MLVSDTRDAFLINEANKQRLIDKLASALQDNGVKVLKKEDDADCGVIRAMLETASLSTATLVAIDTDLLGLLFYHTKPCQKDVHIPAGELTGTLKQYRLT